MSPRDHWPSIAALSSAIHYGGSGLSDVPVLIERVIAEESWRIFQNDLSPEPFVNNTFEEFVTSPPMKGLGASVDLLTRMCQGHKSALDALDRALQQPPGNPTGRNQHSPKVGSLDNIQGSKAPTGTSESAALRRLRKDRPDLHAAVLNGQLTAHAAAVQAGFRPKTFTVRSDRAESIVATLRQQLAPKTLTEVTKLLTETGR